MKKICIVDGHPDPNPKRLSHAIANEYRRGAESAGHQVSRIDISKVCPKPLALRDDFRTDPPDDITEEREKIESADHLVVVFPLWLGAMPAATKAFFEQAARNYFLVAESEVSDGWPRKMMKGKSARVIVTMGVPALYYRLFMRGASVRAFEMGLLGVAGFRPVKHTLFGRVEGASTRRVEKFLASIRELGARGS